MPIFLCPTCVMSWPNVPIGGTRAPQVEDVEPRSVFGDAIAVDGLEFDDDLKQHRVYRGIRKVTTSALTGTLEQYCAQAFMSWRRFSGPSSRGEAFSSLPPT